MFSLECISWSERGVFQLAPSPAQYTQEIINWQINYICVQMNPVLNHKVD